jgi:hypothetical protein
MLSPSMVGCRPGPPGQGGAINTDLFSQSEAE